MRFPKFALWLCAAALLVAVTTAQEDAPDGLAVEPPKSVEELVEGTEAVTDTPPAAVEDEEPLGVEEQTPAEEPAIPQEDPSPVPVNEPTITPQDSARVPVNEPVIIPKKASVLGEDDDTLPDAEGETEEEEEHEEEGEAGDEEEVVGTEAEGEVDAETSEDEAEDETSEDEAESEDLPLPEDTKDASEESETEEMETEDTEAEEMEDDAIDGPLEDATELTPEDAEPVAEDEEEDDAVVVPDVASEEEEDAVAEVTEETKHEDTAPPPEVATHLTTEAPVVDTEVKAEVTEAEEEVVAEPSTSAPVAPLDAVVAPSEVQVNESAAAGEVTTEEVVVAGLTTAAEVAMETGSGEVARDNTSVVELNTTDDATSRMLDNLVEDQDEGIAIIQEEEFYNLSDEQKQNIVTMEFESDVHTESLSVETYEMITQGIFDQLAPVLANITEETFITYVSPSPQSGVRIANGGGWWMQLSIIVRVGESGAIAQHDLFTGLESVNLTSFDLRVVKVSPGMPQYGQHVKEFKELSKIQQMNVLTMNLDYNESLINQDFFQRMLHTLVKSYPSLAGADSGVVFVAPTPVVSMGLLQVIFVVTVGEEGAIPVEQLMVLLKDIDLEEANVKMISMKKGMPATKIHVVEMRELSVEQQQGIVTMELDCGDNLLMHNEHAFATAIDKVREMLKEEGSAGCVVFIAPTPVEDEGKIQASFILRTSKDHAVPQDTLLEALNKIDFAEIHARLAHSFAGMPKYGLPVYANKDLSDAQKAGIVTIEMGTGDMPLNTEFFTHLYGAARKGIMGNLANMTNGSLGFVEPTPIVDGGRVHLSVFLVTKPSVEGEEGSVIPQEDLIEAVRKLNFSRCGVELLKIYAGLTTHELVVKLTDLSETQRNNIVTMVLDTSETDIMVSDLHMFTRLLAAEGAEGDVAIVAPTPLEEGDDQLRVSIVLKHGEDGAVDQEVLLSAVRNVDMDTLDTFLLDAYPGMTKPTTMPPPVFPQIQLEDITPIQRANVVTVEFEIDGDNVNDEALFALHEGFTALLVAELNRMARQEHTVPDVDPDVKRRRREAMEGDVFEEDDVTYVTPTPREQDGKAQYVMVIDDGQGNIASQADVLAAMENLNKTGQLPANVRLVTLYGGLPADMEPTVAPPAARVAGSGAETWDAHMGLFLTIIILATICFIILVIGFTCIKCRSRRGYWSRKDDETPIDQEPEPCGRKYPICIENPMTDCEIMKGEAPMTESVNPAMPYPVSKKDEENGCIVPMDQFGPEEGLKPRMDNTKL